MLPGGKKPVEHHAAVWVPDNEANVCMHCKKTQFTMLVRRVSFVHILYIYIYLKFNIYANSLVKSLQHHCRNCGGVVCGPCSSKKFLLSQQASKPVRVCLDCYDSLSQSKHQQVRAPTPTKYVFVHNIMFYSFVVYQNKPERSNITPGTNDSSGEDDSDDEEENKETHDEVSEPIK